MGITLYHADAVKLQNGNFYIAGLQLLNSKAIRIILGSTGFDLTIISSQRTSYGLREGTALHRLFHTEQIRSCLKKRCVVTS